MNRRVAHLMTRCFALGALLLSVANAHAQSRSLEGAWHVGLELGELPFHGSFKPGISVGYHFNELVYVGFVYQIPDSIARGDTSFNAQATGLEGLTSSRETVGQRAYLQARIRPHRLAPFVSLGIVFNDRDTETITFDDRARTFPGAGGVSSTGAITVVQSRPAGIRPALGLGYSYTFDNGLAVFTEWSGWWVFGAPEPEVTITGALTPGAAERLEDQTASQFTSSVFNTYHLFQLGLGYTF